MQQTLNSPNSSTNLTMAPDALDKLKDAERWANTSSPTAPRTSSPEPESEISLAQPPKPPMLLFISYSKSHDQDPPADLEYNLDGHPSHEEKAMHRGRSTSLQDRLLTDSEFQTELHRAEREIRHLLERRQKEWGAVGDAPTVRVGLKCGEDHPRSVAFAEQIAKQPWDVWEFYDVDVQTGDRGEKVQVHKAGRRAETRVLN
jgi:hypothetical protein